jgi:nitroreductase
MTLNTAARAACPIFHADGRSGGRERGDDGEFMTSTSDKLHFIQSRRSIRSYKPGTIGKDTIQKLLEAAMAAPSAVARDPWRFVVIQNPDMLASLAGNLSNGGMLHDAGLCIAVCADLEAAHDRQLSYALQDCSAAIENMLLAATALGLGSCWLGVHPREERMAKIKSLLGLPDPVIPVSCVAFGHPGEEKPPRTRFKPDLVHWERW